MHTYENVLEFCSDPCLSHYKVLVLYSVLIQAVTIGDLLVYLQPQNSESTCDSPQSPFAIISSVIFYGDIFRHKAWR